MVAFRVLDPRGLDLLLGGPPGGRGLVAMLYSVLTGD